MFSYIFNRHKGIVYIAEGTFGISIWNITNLDRPEKLSELLLGGQAFKLEFTKVL